MADDLDVRRTLTFTEPPQMIDHVETHRRRLRASSLDSLEFRHEVCVLCCPPDFSAVPHYIVLAQLSVRTLSEPDVRR